MLPHAAAAQQQDPSLALLADMHSDVINHMR
jgi:hypothetical protein